MSSETYGPDVPSGPYVLFVEGHGERVSAALRDLLSAVAGMPGCLGAEVLASPAQPGVTLLQARWPHDPPSVPIPAGARSWVFRVELALPDVETQARAR